MSLTVSEKVDIYLSEYDNFKALCRYIKTDTVSSQIKNLGIKNRCLSSVIRFLAPMLSILLTFLSLIYTLVYSIKISFLIWKRGRKEEMSSNNIFLFYTDLLANRLRTSDVSCKDAIWIVGPDVKPLPGTECINIVSLLTYTDVRQSLLASVVAIIKSYIKRPFALVTTYKCAEYFNHFTVLERVTEGKNIYFSNQIDRWALMFDSLPASTKVLLQHGVEYDSLILPHRLKNISIFYAMTNQTWQNCYKGILNCKPELRILKSTIELTEVDDGKPTLLIISNNIFYDVEKVLIEKLSDYRGTIFLKLHPANKNKHLYERLQEQYSFKCIENQTFPKVDMVVSYLSTLAYEYMSFGIPVYIYRNAEDFNVEEILQFVDYHTKNHA